MSKLQLAEMNDSDVRKAYRRWAPVYDATFGKFVEAGVRQATARLNDFNGKLLEVGVGTGLALPHYGPQLQVTGIDLSKDMLAIARKRMERHEFQNVEALVEMDATAMDFSDSTFDVATAMFVMTVVPDPAAVMHELARVVKPGGTILVLSHFSAESGLRGAVEKRMARHARMLGWRPDFPIEALTVSDLLELADVKPARPFGFFTMLEFRKAD